MVVSAFRDGCVLLLSGLALGLFAVALFGDGVSLRVLVFRSGDEPVRPVPVCSNVFTAFSLPDFGCVFGSHECYY
jgi:hypothetical protein